MLALLLMIGSTLFIYSEQQEQEQTQEIVTLIEKTTLLKLSIGDKVETNVKGVKTLGKYKSGTVLGFDGNFGVLGDIVAFQVDGGIEILNETWLQPYVGLSDSTVDDILKGETR